MTCSHLTRDSFQCVTWLIPMCNMTRPYVWHDSFLCVTWLVPICDMTHSYVRYDAFPCATWLVPMSDMTLTLLCSSIMVPCVCESDTHRMPHGFMCVCVMWLIYTWHDSSLELIRILRVWPAYTWHDLFVCVTYLKSTWVFRGKGLELAWLVGVWHSADVYRLCPLLYSIHLLYSIYLFSTRFTLVDLLSCFHLHQKWLICAWHDSFFCVTWHIAIWHTYNHTYTHTHALRRMLYQS